MDYDVVVTDAAERDLDNAVRYLILEKKNIQAAGSLLDDFELTEKMLTRVAGSLKFCDNPRLRDLGYKRINLQTHNYFLLFRIKDHTAVIDAMFHQLQDYGNKMQ